MTQPTLTPEQLLNLAAQGAGRSVKLARLAMQNPARIAALRNRWRRLSSGLAAALPVLLVAVIAGSLIQTNSALVETVWEITAATVLLAGISISMADSKHFYLKPISAQETPQQFEEVQQLGERSPHAKAWLDAVNQQGRELREFDLEIMWALAAVERKSA